jgi:hypothetical protein
MDLLTCSLLDRNILGRGDIPLQDFKTGAGLPFQHTENERKFCG